ncbi:MAG TPA: hypothetical protein VIL26_04050 [Clostridia bacterium]
MRKGITIELDKPRTLRYGMNALAKIEDITQKPIVSLDLNNIGIRDLLAIIYAGLYHEDQTLTIEKVGDLVDEFSDMNKMAEKVGEAFTLAFGGLKESNHPKVR